MADRRVTGVIGRAESEGSLRGALSRMRRDFYRRVVGRSAARTSNPTECSPTSDSVKTENPGQSDGADTYSTVLVDNVQTAALHQREPEGETVPPGPGLRILPPTPPEPPDSASAGSQSSSSEGAPHDSSFTTAMQILSLNDNEPVERGRDKTLTPVQGHFDMWVILTSQSTFL